MNNAKLNKSTFEILIDTRHNSNAKEVFLKLLAKQKKGRNPFDEVRSQTFPLREFKPGADDVY